MVHAHHYLVVSPAEVGKSSLGSNGVAIVKAFSTVFTFIALPSSCSLKPALTWQHGKSIALIWGSKVVSNRFENLTWYCGETSPIVGSHSWVEHQCNIACMIGQETKINAKPCMRHPLWNYFASGKIVLQNVDWTAKRVKVLNIRSNC